MLDTACRMLVSISTILSTLYRVLSTSYVSTRSRWPRHLPFQSSDRYVELFDSSSVRLCVEIFFAFIIVLAGTVFVGLSRAQEPRVELRYPLGPDSFRQDGVPHGKITTHVWKDSKVFPGTIRRYYVYVPAQYDASKPAALMVFQDGHAYINEDGDFRVPIVFDNLIHKGDMPVTIGVFVDPATRRRNCRRSPAGSRSRRIAASSTTRSAATTPSFCSPRFCPRFTRITRSPTIRTATRSAAFRAAASARSRWPGSGPTRFAKCFSHVGSFTNIRGGDRYPGMIRKGNDKRPMRIFLQDGSNDLDNRHGNWPLGNQQMYAALKFRDYDVNFVYGEGGHNDNHGGAILPDSLRWLWRDYKLPDS